MNEAQDWVTFALALAAALGVLGGYFRWVLPRYRRLRSRVVAAWHSIFGRDAILDSTTGREIEPALPGVGMRLADQARDLSLLTESVAAIAKSHARLDDLDIARLDHENRIVKLEEAAVERVVTRAESAAAFRAMEAAVKAQPDEEPDL
jgi:hypothetical protein